MPSVQEVRETLLRTDQEFRQLDQQHRELDARIKEISSQHYRAGDVQLERITLKKRKLQLKDRMEDNLRNHRTSPTGSALRP